MTGLNPDEMTAGHSTAKVRTVLDNRAFGAGFH